MASDSMERSESLSGLTASEAKAFHGLFMRSFFLFMFWAFIAHMLVWYFKPWLGVIQ
ncbi:MAG: light-harvesting antenna LH1, beta subunit [Pseudomonadota bacterium]